MTKRPKFSCSVAFILCTMISFITSTRTVCAVAQVAHDRRSFSLQNIGQEKKPPSPGPAKQVQSEPPTPAVSGSTFFVNRFDDAAPGAVADTCNNASNLDTSSSCSLREAVRKANATPGFDTIQLAAGAYTLTQPRISGDFTALGGTLSVRDSVNIVGVVDGSGAPASIVRACNPRPNFTCDTGVDKVFSFNPDITDPSCTAGCGFSDATVNISNLMIRFGHNRGSSTGLGDGFGGGFDFDTGSSGNANLTVTNCVITDNATTDGNGGGVALFNSNNGSGSVHFVNSTIENNSAVRAVSTGAAGGGMFIGAGGQVVLDNTNVVNNSAIQTTPTRGAGGGISSFATSLALHASNVSGNQTSGAGGGIVAGAGLTIDTGTVISNNQAGVASDFSNAGNGAGILIESGSGAINISKTTITGNKALGGTGALTHGGGIFVPSNPPTINIQFSRLTGNTASIGSNISYPDPGDAGPGISATNNWWGTNSPHQDTAMDRSGTLEFCNVCTSNITFDPFIVLSHTANPSTANIQDNVALVASFLQDNHGAAILASNLDALFGVPVTYNSNTVVNGMLINIPAQIESTGTGAGTATATFQIGNASGTASADVTVDNATVTATVNVVQPPDLSMFITHNGGGFNQGDTGRTYTIRVSNVGQGPTLGAQAPDVIAGFLGGLPSGLTATSLAGTGWTCDLGMQSCARHDVLAAGASYPDITLTVNVAFNAPSTLAVTSVVGGGGAERNLSNNSAADQVSVKQFPDMRVDVTPLATFFQGGTGQYFIAVSNINNAPTTSAVTVTDTLPTGLTATAISGDGWTCPTLTTCNRSDAITDAVYPLITLTVSIANNAPASVLNTATVSGGGEINTANDTGTFLTPIVQPPDLTVTKSHTGNFSQGQTGATYTLTVNNIGPTATSGTVTVTDTLPAGLTATAISGTGWTCRTLTSCNRSDSLAGSSSYPPITLTVNVANNAPASVTNMATVSGGSEVNTANDAASDPTTVVQFADLTVTKSHIGNFTQGQTGATYTITVSNIGAAATSGTVTVTDTLPGAGLIPTAISGTGWTCTALTSCNRSDALAAGGSYPAITLTVNVAGNAPAWLSNSVTVSGGGEINTANDTATDPTTIIQVADLVIAKSHTGNFTQGQTNATYTLTVSNVGPGPSVGTVTVNDTLPTGLSASAISGAGWTCPTLTSCNRSDALAAGGSYPAITLTVSVANNAPNMVTNSVTVSGGGEIIMANDTATDPTMIVPVADLTIAKSHTGNFTQGQMNAAYTLTVSNLGPGPTIGIVTVTDTLPTGLSAAFISGSGWICPTLISCNRSDVLAPGNSYPPITLTVRVDNNAPASLTNTAMVSGGGELNVANDTASDPTTIIQIKAGALYFVPVTPCRVADTRNPAGPFGGPFLSGGTSRAFTVPASACNIPAEAQAYSINATVVPKTTLGFLTMFPCGQSLPLTSTLNSDGRIKAAAAIVPAGTSGSVCAFASNDTEFIMDIDGYFIPATNASAMAFYPVPPCRLVDTRLAASPLGGPSLGGGTSRTFPILSSPCNVPGTAQAYSLNFTSVPKTGTLGFLTTWPAGQNQPLVSTLNAPTGAVTANAAIVPAGTNGGISVFVTNDTDLVIDIDGYFAPPAQGGLSLFTLTPCRVIDTRNPAGSPPFNGLLNVNVEGSNCSVPASAKSYVLNATVVPPGPLGFLTLWPAGSTQPSVSTLNAGDGAITSNLALVPTTNGSISAFVSQATHLVVDISGYFDAPVASAPTAEADELAGVPQKNN